MNSLSYEKLENETYYCPHCETTDYTDEWKCTHCGNYIRITAIIFYNTENLYKKVEFIRKPIDEVNIGDNIIINYFYIYKVLNKKAIPSKRYGHSYKLSLQKFGTKVFGDERYYNCVL